VPTPVPTSDGPAAEFDQAFITSLRLGVMRLSRRLRRERDPADLTLSQLAVLGTLSRNGPCTLRRLADEEKVSAPSMTRIVNHLVVAGLATRTAHGSDGRQVVIAMTEPAVQLLESYGRQRDLWLAERFNALDPEQQALLRRALPLLELMAQQ
jgi:DNA-binding MarR family transcriptional regulator